MYTGLEIGKLHYLNEDGELQEIGSIEKFENIGVDFAEGEDTQTNVLINSLTNEKVTISIKPTYKEWHKNRKGKRYIPYYIIKEGIDPKIIKMLLGGK